MKATNPIEVSSYQTASGAIPLEEWLDGLDKKSRSRLLARIAKVRAGNLGDWSALSETGGVCELREFFGPGFRIYFGREAEHIVLLLCGSDKSDQKKTIKLATSYWQDYQAGSGDTRGRQKVQDDKIKTNRENS